jgi:NAD(P)-dependent dehydrogenase (short-subunit alcohol dehydrogenase family)
MPPLPSPVDTPQVVLSGRVVMITGASGGVGRAVALACAARGATLVLHGRVVRKLEAIYDEIVAADHPQPTILPLDLAAASADDFGHVASAIRAQLGRLDALVHAAAFLGSLGPVEHQSFDAWQKVLRINLAAAMAMTRSTLPLLSKAPDASVVFTLDARGEDPRAYWGAYGAAKSGLSALASTLADEWENSAQSADQRRRARTDSLAAPGVDAPGRGPVGASRARRANTALSLLDRRPTQVRELARESTRRRGWPVKPPPPRSSRHEPPAGRSAARRAGAGIRRRTTCRAVRRLRRPGATTAGLSRRQTMVVSRAPTNVSSSIVPACERPS